MAAFVPCIRVLCWSAISIAPISRARSEEGGSPSRHYMPEVPRGGIEPPTLRFSSQATSSPNTKQGEPKQGGAQYRYYIPEAPSGAQGRNRTADTAIFSRMLYRLSYLDYKTRHKLTTNQTRPVRQIYQPQTLIQNMNDFIKKLRDIVQILLQLT